MEADEWFILILIDALVSVPLYFTVIIFLLGQSEKQYLNELETYFVRFIVVCVTSIVVLKKSNKSDNKIRS